MSDEQNYSISLKSDGSVIITARANTPTEFGTRIADVKEFYNTFFAGAGAADKPHAKEQLPFTEELPGPEDDHKEAARKTTTPAGVTPKCQFCGGPMYDNTGPGKKLSPKSPDYKCKAKACSAAAWYRGGALSWSKQA